MWKKVLGPTILMSLLWIAGSAISTWYIHKLYSCHSQAMSEDVATLRDAWSIQNNLWRIQAVVVKAGGKASHEARVEVSNREASIERHLAGIRATDLTAEESRLVEALDQRWAVYRKHIEGRLKSADLAGPSPSQAAENEETIRLACEASKPCQDLIEPEEDELTESTATIARLSTWINLVRFGFLIAGPVLGILCGLWVARGLNRSISQISVSLNSAAGGEDHELGSVKVRAGGDLPGLHQQVQVVAARMRQVMEELQQTRRQAMSAERLAAVGELAAGIAHELRNPLTSIKLLVQTAQRQVGNESAGKQLQVVQQEIGRLENTIQGLLDFARPPELHRVPHDLRTTVRRAMNLVEGRARQQRVAINAQLPDAAVTVDGDPEQLHQIFINLLLNGIEAMPDGGILAITVPATHRNAGICRVSVADTGTGIPQSILARIFEPFVTSKEHGTGLGLAVSRRIVAEHSGTLLARNRAEGGAIFTVELPVIRTGTADTETPAAKMASRLS
jgi:signal transduction histidine kinase